MIKLEKQASGFFRLDPPNPNRAGYKLLQKLGLNGPDLRRNPSLWMRALVYGPTALRRTFEAARGATRLADLGCGNGWLALELARRSPDAVVDAVESDDRALAWGRDYYEHLRSSSRLGEIRYHSQTVEAFELAEEHYDVIVLSFVLSRLDDAGVQLGRVARALRPGGMLVYYDATDPPPITVDRLATVLHRLARLRGQMSDLWNQRRKLEAAYLKDAVRRLRAEDAPPEQHLFHRIEETFEVVYQLRNRAFIDLMLDTLAPRRMVGLPLLKLADDLSVSLGFFEGACRFAVARKR